MTIRVIEVPVASSIETIEVKVPSRIQSVEVQIPGLPGPPGGAGAPGTGMDSVVWEFHATENQPIQLEPGQLIAIRNPVAMDAAGTFQLQVDAAWHEAPALDWA